jgi:hypothetical protein
MRDLYKFSVFWTDLLSLLKMKNTKILTCEILLRLHEKICDQDQEAQTYHCCCKEIV